MERAREVHKTESTAQRAQKKMQRTLLDRSAKQAIARCALRQLRSLRMALQLWSVWSTCQRRLGEVVRQADDEIERLDAKLTIYTMRDTLLSETESFAALPTPQRVEPITVHPMRLPHVTESLLSTLANGSADDRESIYRRLPSKGKH